MTSEPVKTIVDNLRHAYRRVSGRSADFLPRSVYHYTSAAGLFGILDSGVLRGSNFAYLNDSSEIRYGEAVVQEILAERLVSASGDAKIVLEIVLNTLGKAGGEIEFYLV